MNKIIIYIFLCFLFSGVICAQTTHVLKTRYLPAEDTVQVFIPSNYNHQKDYPLIILLHGYSGNYKTWNKFTPLQDYSNKYQFIIVCPDGLYDSWYLNSPVHSSIQFENFFFMRLLPYLFRNYSVDKKNIFLSGLSMGGYGSLYLYSTHPRIFKSVGSTSGLIDPEDFYDNYGIEKIIGPLVQEYSISKRIESFKNLKNKPLIDCGTEDPFYKQNLDFKKLLDKNKIPVNFITTPGSHNRDYWEQSIIKHFEHFNSLINK